MQNDGGNVGRDRKAGRELANLEDILIGGFLHNNLFFCAMFTVFYFAVMFKISEIPLKDENNHEPTVQARQHRTHQHLGSIGAGVTRLHGGHPDMTSLEIGMYVLLAAFCFAIVVFVVSCVVYASKFKPVNDFTNFDGGIVPPGVLVVKSSTPLSFNNANNAPKENNRKPRESTTNAHDWVWLGRATLERGGPASKTADQVNGNEQIRITNNPLSLNYCEPEDALTDANMATSFDNPTHIELPSRSSRVIDSSTYCKKDRPPRAAERNSSRQSNTPNNWQP